MIRRKSIDDDYDEYHVPRLSPSLVKTMGGRQPETRTRRRSCQEESYLGEGRAAVAMYSVENRLCVRVRAAEHEIWRGGDLEMIVIVRTTLRLDEQERKSGSSSERVPSLVVCGPNRFDRKSEGRK